MEHSTIYHEHFRKLTRKSTRKVLRKENHKGDREAEYIDERRREDAKRESIKLQGEEREKKWGTRINTSRSASYMAGWHALSVLRKMSSTPPTDPWGPGGSVSEGSRRSACPWHGRLRGIAQPGGSHTVYVCSCMAKGKGGFVIFYVNRSTV